MGNEESKHSSRGREHTSNRQVSENQTSQIVENFFKVNTEFKINYLLGCLCCNGKRPGCQSIFEKKIRHNK